MIVVNNDKLWSSMLLAIVKIWSMIGHSQWWLTMVKYGWEWLMMLQIWQGVAATYATRIANRSDAADCPSCNHCRHTATSVCKLHQPRPYPKEFHFASACTQKRKTPKSGDLKTQELRTSWFSKAPFCPSCFCKVETWDARLVGCALDTATTGAGPPRRNRQLP